MTRRTSTDNRVGGVAAKNSVRSDLCATGRGNGGLNNSGLGSYGYNTGSESNRNGICPSAGGMRDLDKQYIQGTQTDGCHSGIFSLIP